MTHVDTASTSDPRLLERVRAAAQPDRTLATALHDSAAVLGIQMHWHEADVLAEAVRGHHDKTLAVYRVVYPEIPLDDVLAMGERKHMLDELLHAAHSAGMALVTEPTERVDRIGGLLMDEAGPAKEIGVHLAGLYPDRHLVIILTGKCRALVKAT